MIAIASPNGLFDPRYCRWNIFRLRELLFRYNTCSMEGFMNGIIYLVGLVVVVLAVLSLFGLR